MVSFENKIMSSLLFLLHDICEVFLKCNCTAWFHRFVLVLFSRQKRNWRNACLSSKSSLATSTRTNCRSWSSSVDTSPTRCSGKTPTPTWDRCEPRISDWKAPTWPSPTSEPERIDLCTERYNNFLNFNWPYIFYWLIELFQGKVFNEYNFLI